MKEELWGRTARDWWNSRLWGMWGVKASRVQCGASKERVLQRLEEWGKVHALIETPGWWGQWDPGLGGHRSECLQGSLPASYPCSVLHSGFPLLRTNNKVLHPSVGVCVVCPRTVQRRTGHPLDHHKLPTVTQECSTGTTTKESKAGFYPPR